MDHDNGTRRAWRSCRATFAAAVLATAAATPAVGLAAESGDPARDVELAANLRLSIIGLTDDQRLITFRVAAPQVARPIGTVSGLQAPDTSLVGIDFRVQDGNLYGLGDRGGIYAIDPTNAAASPVTRLTVALSGNRFGIDFNPAANALRIVSDTGQNLRHPFAGPLQFQTQSDDPLDYPPATPPNTPGPTATGIAATAYTNNDLDANTGTTQYDIDTTRNQVAVQSPPNNGTLVATGALGVDAEGPAGLDIYTALRDGSAVRNSGFAVLSVNGVTGLYRVDLLTGKVGLIARPDQRLIDIAIPLNQ